MSTTNRTLWTGLNPIRRHSAFLSRFQPPSPHPHPSVEFVPDILEHWNWRADSLYSVSQNLRFSNPNNMKWRHDDVIAFFSQSVYKTCQRQLTALKLSRLTAYLKFHKICKFYTMWQEMMSWRCRYQKQWKTMENADLRGTKQNVYHSKAFVESYPKK